MTLNISRSWRWRDAAWLKIQSIYLSISIGEPVTHLKRLTKRRCCVLVWITHQLVIGEFIYLHYSLFNIYSFDGENFQNLTSSKCDHDLTYGLANYKGLALTTGSAENSTCHVHTELYDLRTNQWTNAPDFHLTDVIIE